MSSKDGCVLRFFFSRKNVRNKRRRGVVMVCDHVQSVDNQNE